MPTFESRQTMSLLAPGYLPMKWSVACGSTAYVARLLVMVVGLFSMLIAPAMAQTEVAA